MATRSSSNQDLIHKPNDERPLADSSKAVAHASDIPQFVAGLDFLAAGAFAWMTFDYPLISLSIIALTWPLVVGLSMGKAWGWRGIMLLHGLLLMTATCCYAYALTRIMKGFGEPSHMLPLKPEVEMVVLTILFILAAIAIAAPMILLGLRRSRTACGLAGSITESQWRK